MSKVTRYLLAFLACAAIFALWIIFQMFVAKGMLVAVVFCGAMVATWKAITKSSK